MNIRKSLLALTMVGVMTAMSGCGKKNNKIEKDNDTIEDLGGEIVLKVGDTAMTDNQFQFFLDQIKTQMKGTELSTEESWETAEIEGRKAIEVAKEKAYDIAVEYLSVIEIGKKTGLECTEEEIESTKSKINTAYFEKYPDGDAIVEFMCEEQVYLGKMQQNFLKENELKDEDIQKYFDENKEEISEEYLRAKHVLILTQDETTQEPLSDEEIAKKKVKAEDILKRAQNGEDFDSLVEQYSEDPGSATYADGYVFTSGEMMAEFENCVRGLEINGIGFAETSYGCHIIKRLDLDLGIAECKSKVKDKMYNEKFEEYIEPKMQEYNIEVIKNDEKYNEIK